MKINRILDFTGKKLLMMCGLILLSSSLSSQDIFTKGNGKNVIVFNEADLEKLDRIDSISDLCIIINKKPKRILSVKLKHPELLRGLSIHHPQAFVFKDSVPNLNSLGIEGEFYWPLNIRFDPLKIDTLSMFTIKNKDLSFFEKLKNLRYLNVGFYAKPENFFEPVSKLRSLNYLGFTCLKGKAELPMSVVDLVSLEEIDGYMKFDSANLSLLAKMNTLKTIKFYSVKIKNIPKEYFDLKDKKAVIFQHCKGKLPPGAKKGLW